MHTWLRFNLSRALVLLSLGAGTRAQCTIDAAAINAVTAACCIGQTCTGGTPEACTARCATVFVPFYRECQAALRPHKASYAEYSTLFAKCAAAGPTGTSAATSDASACIGISVINSVTTACCTGEDCTAGIPKACSTRCAGVFVPFFNKCRVVLRPHKAAFTEYRALFTMCTPEATPAPTSTTTLLAAAPHCVDGKGWATKAGAARTCATYANVKPGAPSCTNSATKWNQFGWGGYWCKKNGMGGQKCCAKSCDNCPGTAAGANATVTAVPTTPPSGNTAVIDMSTPAHTISDHFLSFTIDAYHVRSGGGTNWGKDFPFGTPLFGALAQLFSPAYVRVGGNAADAMTYNMGGVDGGISVADAALPLKGAKQSVMTKALWDSLNKWASTAGWGVVFALNPFVGWNTPGPSHEWDDTNAEELITYTLQRKYNVVGWELGNEPNLQNKGTNAQGAKVAQTAATLNSHFSQLHKLLLTKYSSTGGGTRTSPYVVGPDSTKTTSAVAFTKAFLDVVEPADGPNAVTWHQYYRAGKKASVTPESFLDPSVLDIFVTSAQAYSKMFKSYTTKKPGAQLWVGETGGVGGVVKGAKSIFGRFVSSIWWMDKLGASASSGHAVVMRQEWSELVKGGGPAGVTIYPDFWSALLWKRLMGTSVLTVQRPGLPKTTRMYAHAGADGVTVLIINLARTAANVNLAFVGGKPSAAARRQEYHLTAWPDATNLTSTDMALNGARLQINSGSTVRAQLPGLLQPRAANGDVVVAATSIVFVVVPSAGPGHK